MITRPMQWTTLWVDSTDRSDWLDRIKRVFDLPGVEKVLPDPRNGQIRIRYNPKEITVFQLSAHLRAAGL